MRDDENEIGRPTVPALLVIFAVLVVIAACASCVFSAGV